MRLPDATRDTSRRTMMFAASADTYSRIELLGDSLSDVGNVVLVAAGGMVLAMGAIWRPRKRGLSK